MGGRITLKDLDHLVSRINEATGLPAEPYTIIGIGLFAANVGNYHLDSVYGGVKLIRVTTDSGGIEEISTGGFITKRELYTWMSVFLAGLFATQVREGKEVSHA